MENLEPTSSVTSQLRNQWSNPDILALLLLVGGDIIQKALAQFVGVPFTKLGVEVYLTPVAFSFGWVSYAFIALMSCVGNNKLMPEPDCFAKVINCDNAYSRINRSWVLGRILRDHIAKNEVNKAEISIRIDIFELTDEEEGSPSVDWVWMMGWMVIAIQLIIALVAWVVCHDWAVFMVTLAGTLGALYTGSLQQWTDEKWPIQRWVTKGKKKIVCLTPGNGHHHVMVIIADGKGYDLEAMAGSLGKSQESTKLTCIILTVWWIVLLIVVAGLVKLRWFLFGIGGLGMIQNICAAGIKREPSAFNVSMKPYATCPKILGHREAFKDKKDDPADSDEDLEPFHERWEKGGYNRGVMGALMAIENILPKVGATLATEFFPGGLTYKPERYHFNREKKFWKMAFRRIKKNPRPRPVAPPPQAYSSTSHEKQSSSDAPTGNTQFLLVSHPPESQVECTPSSSSTEVTSVKSVHPRESHDVLAPAINLPTLHSPDLDGEKAVG